MNLIESLDLVPPDTAFIVEHERQRLASISWAGLTATTEGLLGIEPTGSSKFDLAGALAIHAMAYAESREQKAPTSARGADVVNAAFTVVKTMHGFDPDTGRKITAPRFDLIRRIALGRLITSEEYDHELFVSAYRYSYLSEALQLGTVHIAARP